METLYGKLTLSGSNEIAGTEWLPPMPYLRANNNSTALLRKDFNWPQRILGNSDCFEACCVGLQ